MIPSASRKSEIILGVFILTAMGFFIWLAFQIRPGSIGYTQTYVLTFDNAIGLVKDNPVTVAGVAVGSVSDIEVSPDQKAWVHVQLDPKVKLYADASAAIRAKSLLGEKYVALSPGTPSAAPLPSGTRITAYTPTIDVDQVIREAGVLLAKVNRWTKDMDPSQWTETLTRLNPFLDRLELLLTHAQSLLQNMDLKDAQALVRSLNTLVEKANGLNEKTLREFFQVDGIRIRLFENPEIKKLLKSKS